MPNSHDSDNISRESENVILAKTIIAGQDANVDYRKTAHEITVGVAMGLFGWIAAQLHLRVFDKIYLWWGSEKRLLGSQNRISKE
jgi:hypothetical protein